MANVGLFGVGTVGSCVLRQLEKEEGVTIKKIVRKSGGKFGPYICSTEPSSVLDDKEIDIVVELIGGIEPAYGIIKNALENGKSVVTANKSVIDRYGKELEEIAGRNSVYLLFEGAVGGGIPIINSLRFGLSGNRTNEIFGIINGTTNFILTKMTKDGYSYEKALLEAQELGFAEKDPSFDVEGKDAAQKIAILASINFSTKIDSGEIEAKGIANVTYDDIQFASELGYRIKLIAVARQLDNGVDVRVSPMLVSKKHPLAYIDYDMNAIFLGGSTHVTLAGEGAGGNPTASAVISDIKTIVQNMGGDYVPTRYFGDRKVKMLGKDEISSEFYLNFEALNKPGTLNSLTSIFKDRRINILQVIQKGRGNYVPLIIHTDIATFKSVEDALGLIDGRLLKVRSAFPILQV
ncbi:homoserine dehydrogenase [Candidatus Woesearchaeota archaeon]|nr:homoserine dehydrogenase [Candidatus Woesearchaeota archaeon]